MATKGKIQIEIETKDKASAKMGKIGKSTDDMKQKFNLLKVAIVGMGIALGVALTKMVTSYAKVGDEIAKMSERLGIGTVALSEMRHVAALAGTDLGTFEIAIKAMSKAITGADEGLSTYTRAFDRIGISVKDLLKLNQEERFWVIAKALSAVEDAGLKSATASEIFGKSGTELITVLNQTAEAIDAQIQEAHNLNQVWSEEAAAAAEAFQDAANNMKEAVAGLTNILSESLLPKITAVVEAIEGQLKPVLSWLKEHPEMADAFLAFAGVLGGAIVIGAITVLILKIKTLIASLTIAHALGGPGMWAKWTLGIAAAAGGIAYINRMLAEQVTGGVTPEAHEAIKKGLAAGTITPEMLPLGYEIPKGEKGGIIKSPTLALLGERGPEAIIPLARGAGNIVHFEQHIHIGNFMGDEASQRALIRKQKELMAQEMRRTSFAGINRLEYFPGSSAP